MAKACTKNEFDMLMDTIEKEDIRVKEYLELAGYEKWTLLSERKACTCGRFQYEEIPYEHAWIVLKWKSLPPDEYCSDLYKPKTMLKTYNMPVHPLPGVKAWLIPDSVLADEVLPPKFKRPTGKPKGKPKKKARKLSRIKGKNTCSTCGMAGHNRLSCRNKPQDV
ncbi:uncharacterized protein [Solanum lycopersicum]|uniref:uncharacterized protein n=1 Tax=Solanum lycopersicum TaxID=4081 RepID=UPI00374A128B